MIRSKSGFSVIELLVVMAIVGTLLSVSVPAIKRLYAAFKYDNEKRYLQSLVPRYATLAFISSQPLILRFEANSLMVAAEKNQVSSLDFIKVESQLIKKYEFETLRFPITKIRITRYGSFTPDQIEIKRRNSTGQDFLNFEGLFQ